MHFLIVDKVDFFFYYYLFYLSIYNILPHIKRHFYFFHFSCNKESIFNFIVLFYFVYTPLCSVKIYYFLFFFAFNSFYVIRFLCSVLFFLLFFELLLVVMNMCPVCCLIHGHYQSCNYLLGLYIMMQLFFSPFVFFFIFVFFF